MGRDGRRRIGGWRMSNGRTADGERRQKLGARRWRTARPDGGEWVEGRIRFFVWRRGGMAIDIIQGKEISLVEAIDVGIIEGYKHGKEKKIEIIEEIGKEMKIVDIVELVEMERATCHHWVMKTLKKS
ncbi:Glycerol-3-phosphate dehydrogenase [NAD(P)+] [Striga asiatica]|uniref:Glycerol-3-phosphate dehydrogenase [NAD(P)+] n=1 Tax=Striga asiatica TaxID=4170 RepID=A0A5A7Q4J7_STRAF|nr:Glycerol-3-phosphate dehydrogenase [NAD(P)+] [Striga asiatica]